MKRLLLALATLTLGAFLTSGCSHYSSSRHRLTNAVAIALTVNGNERPTPEQWKAVYAAVEPQLAAAGWVLVTDLRQADRILRIDFTPNPLDPMNSGHATVLSMAINPRGPSAPSLGNSSGIYSYTGYNSSMSPWSGYNSYDRWSDGSYSYTPPASSRPSNPPSNHPGNNRDDCPPGTNDRPPRYADTGRSSTPREHGTWRDHTPSPSYSSPGSDSYSSSSSSSSGSSFSSSSSSDFSSSSSSSSSGSFGGSSGSSDSNSNKQQN